MVSVRMSLHAGGPPAPKAARLAAWPVLVISTVLARRMPLRLTLWTARSVKRFVRHHPASAAQARCMIAARDWAAARFPGRSACMEASLAAFLLAALHGWAVDWCIGCRFRPAQSHAWIETGGGPVGEPDTPERPFHVTIRI